MLPHGKKLGLLLSGPPEQAGFLHGARLAEAALAQGVEVYVYCIDEAVRGVNDPRLQALKSRGLKLYGCAYAAQRHSVPMTEAAVFAGLAVVSDLMAGTDRFLCFN